MAKNVQGQTHANLIAFLKYLAASAFALALDYSCYWALATYKILNLPQAAVVGYTVGLIAAYFLIANRVFKNGWLRDKKHYELILFFISGLLGIVLTYLTVKLFVFFLGEKLVLAKLTAVGISFCGVLWFRKKIVFRAVANP